jgi:hydroxymethylpyrimidine pyrophosphatase-like HAD family hydrolase
MIFTPDTPPLTDAEITRLMAQTDAETIAEYRDAGIDLEAVTARMKPDMDRVFKEFSQK